MFESNEALIDSLMEEGVLKTPRIIEAFGAVDRKDFVPPELQADAYVNAPLPIGFNQTISQPLTVAFMLELLEPRPGEKILDVGSGSGWQTALIAHVVSDSISKIKYQKSKIYDARLSKTQTLLDAEVEPKIILPLIRQRGGKVFAVERIPKLCAFGKSNVSKYNFVSRGIVEFFCQDGSLGFPEHAPFDKIIAAASARELPPAWREQLKIGGRIVTPIQNSVWLFEKIDAAKWRETEYPGFAFVPLVKASDA